MSTQPKLFAFIGSYALEEEESVYACSYNGETGELNVLDRITGLLNPTFLDVDPDRKMIYVIAETKGEDNSRQGIALSYSFDPDTGKLTEVNRVETMDAPTCHISLDATRQCLFTASYHGGLISVSPILEDGRIGATSQLIRHEGSSVKPPQTQARAHSVTVSPNNRHAVVCDLGADRIAVYHIHPDEHKLTPAGDIRLEPGAGPRHFAFHPSRPFAYVINELNDTVNAYAYDPETGRLTELQSIGTLPEGYDGKNEGTADIHISPEGRFLYGSNRGHDSIAVYSINPEAGTLTFLAHTFTQGGHPRNFGLDLEGRFLLAANRDGDNVVTFRRDAETGLLHATGSELHLPKPVCIRFARF